MNHVPMMIPVAVLWGAVLFAQETPPPRAADPQPQLKVENQVQLSDVLGCDVWLQPTVGPREGQPAEPRSGEAAVRAKDKKGSIDDLILEGRNGEATWAVVSVGGMLGIGDRLVLVPASALTPVRKDKDSKPEFGLHATEAELKSLPAFDKKAAQKSGLRAALHPCETAWQKARPGETVKGTKRGDPGHPAEATGRPGEATEAGLASANMILGTQLQGCAVRTKDLEAGKNFGEIDGASFNLHNHSVEYVIVGQGGVLGIGETDYVVPIEACRITVVGEDKKPAIALDKTSSEMESAPKYSKPDQGFISEANAHSACKFYGVQKPRTGHPTEGDKEPGK